MLATLIPSPLGVNPHVSAPFLFPMTRSMIPNTQRQIHENEKSFDISRINTIINAISNRIFCVIAFPFRSIYLCALDH